LKAGRQAAEEKKKQQAKQAELFNIYKVVLFVNI